jgi:hypothetical protein
VKPALKTGNCADDGNLGENNNAGESKKKYNDQNLANVA